MGKRVLFVDGDQTVMETVNVMLEGLGHEVHLEVSGTGAMSAFSNGPNAFDLVIADVGMPDISGLLLVEKLLKVRADIPVILLTGPEGQAQSRARESGIRWFGVKPLSITELAGTVEQALSGAPAQGPEAVVAE